ncbi:HNH endonuclease [Pseudovibrio ascidiaceicola]|uniref:HNH endonuclease n=1 Tax=Pseudovibrio ascidiaceicola TaxID=285279 RepID=UPI003D3685A6
MGQQLKDSGVDVDKARSDYKKLQNMQAEYLDLSVQAGLAAGGALPPPLNLPADIGAVGYSLSKGDWWGAALDVVGFIPVVDILAKGGKIADKLNDIRKAINIAGPGLQKGFNKTKDVAAKYWDDLAKKNRKAYDDAIKNCKTKACKEKHASKKGPQYNNTPKTGDGKKGKWEGERGDSKWIPANGEPPVEYKNGFPDFGPHSKGDVEIPMTGNNKKDFPAADKAMQAKLGDPEWKKPEGYTWHHKEDGVTMQLVPSKMHANGGDIKTTHVGGAAMYNGGHASDF